jgi:rod shape-determining protein MreD
VSYRRPWAGRVPISYAVGLALLLVLALAQSSWGSFLSIGGVHPDLVLVVVVAWTLLQGPRDGLLWALIGGLCLDFLSSGPFGVVTIALLAVALLASLGYGRVFGGYVTLPLMLVFPLSLVYYLIQMTLLGVLGRQIIWIPTLTNVVLAASLLNIVVILLLLPLLRWLQRRIGREEMGW